MVYCGKASQGCQSCRTRRIKCDKVRPDCSQCIRVGKKCPGYRDQLSLMFRDESSKVIQKAHAQWGSGESPEPSSSTLSPITRTQPLIEHTLPSPSASQASTSTSLTPYEPSATPYEPGALQPAIMPTQDELGFQFFINRYVIGHPDEPRSDAELSSYGLIWEPTLRDIVTAVGLASISNLRGDAELMVDARRRYGDALRTAGQIIHSSSPVSIDIMSRLVVMLAMFELVKGTPLTTGSIYAHVAGGAALIRSWFPMREESCKGVRPLLQLCYTTFITAFDLKIPLPTMFHDWVQFARQVMQPIDVPAADLGRLIPRFIKLSVPARSRTFRDGEAGVREILKKLINIELEMEAWEDSLEGIWRYKTYQAPYLPAPAVFEGEYHIYHDMFVARIWNHYRWARVLINQVILDTAAKYPKTNVALEADINHIGRQKTMVKYSRDILISTCCHWRHPLLDGKMPPPAEQQGTAGIGAAGVSVLLFQLKMVACAPSSPREFWDWSYGVANCIWGDMGILHARNMLDEMDAAAVRWKVEALEKSVSPPTMKVNSPT